MPAALVPCRTRRPVPARLLAAAMLVAASLAGCGSNPARTNVSLQEDFNSADTYSRSFRATGEQTCEAARRALLSQGYVIDSVRTDQVNGAKAFQPEAEIHVQIAMHIVCTAEADGTGSLAFVSAVQDRFSLKKSNTAASLGVGVLGSVSLPLAASNDSMVKIASETITSGLFYDRFFTLVARFLPGGEHDLPVAGPDLPATAP